MPNVISEIVRTAAIKGGVPLTEAEQQAVAEYTAAAALLIASAQKTVALEQTMTASARAAAQRAHEELRARPQLVERIAEMTRTPQPVVISEQDRAIYETIRNGHPQRLPSGDILIHQDRAEHTRFMAGSHWVEPVEETPDRNGSTPARIRTGI